MAKPGRRPEIRSDITAMIVQKIIAGAFPTVAATSSGVNESTFLRWLRRGRRTRSPKAYRNFYNAIEGAKGKACHDAETRVFTKEPLEWLRRGPGRSRWGDRTEIEISGNPRRPLEISEASPFSIVALAQSQVILAEVGVIPELTDDAKKSLVAFGESQTTKEDDDESRQELTGVPEWMKRKAAAGRKHGSKKKKKAALEKKAETNP
jgi:hypothetical protein